MPILVSSVSGTPLTPVSGFDSFSLTDISGYGFTVGPVNSLTRLCSCDPYQTVTISASNGLALYTPVGSVHATQVNVQSVNQSGGNTGLASATGFKNAKPTVDIYTESPNGYGQSLFQGTRQPLIYTPQSGSYYVSNSTANGMIVGSDSTGTGTFANPWLTIDKALVTVPATGDVTIYVNDGTYSESSLATGRLIPRTVFTNWISVEPVTGKRNAVTITTASSAAGAINCTNSYSCGRIQFRRVNVQPGTTQAPAFNVSSSNGNQNSIHFVECGIAGSNGASFAYTVWFQGDGGFEDFALINCTFLPCVNAGAQQPVMVGVVPATIAGNGKYNDFLIYGCNTAPTANYQGAGAILGLNGLCVVNNNFSVGTTYGFIVGLDASTNAVAFTQSNVYIAGNYFSAAGTSQGHGLLIGFGCQGAVAEYNYVNAGVQGIVVKGATNTTVRNNTVNATSAGVLNGLYAKASVGTTFLGNSVYANGTNVTSCFREDWDNTTSVPSKNTTLIGNSLIADGSAVLMTWANTPDSQGGAVCDWNVYEIRNSGAWGLLRSHTVTSLADLKAGWATYGLSGDLATNDSNSQQNLAGSRTDISYTGPSATYTITYQNSAGQVFNGWITEAYNPTYHYRSVFGMQGSATAGTYTDSVPFNLPSGAWQYMVRRQTGNVPSPSDPIVATGAISYAS